MASNRFLLSVCCVALLFVGSIATSSSSASSSSSSSSDESSSEIEQPKSTEFVVTLDHSNFTDFVGKHKFIVVEFYAPWCGVCKKLAPEYEKAAEILSKEDPPIVLAKVDANEESNKILAHEYDVSGYPTIKILRYGASVVQEFKGPREAAGIAAYVIRENGPATAELKSAEEVSALVGDKKIVVVGVFPEFSGEKFENFTTLAERLRSEYELRHTLDAKLLPHGDSSVGGPVIRLFKPFDEPFLDFQDFDVDSVEKLIQESSTATVTFFDKDAKNHPYVVKFFNSQDEKAMMFINTSSKIYDTLEAKYHEVAKEYKGKGISFLIGDVEASHGAFQFFGLKEDQVPLIIIQTNDGSKYVKEKVEVDDISVWVKDFKDGKLKPFKKSEPVPENNSDPVKVVVADTFDDLVFKSGKNVLLEFYAPWCGHCKKLAPILDEVAVSFANDADVLIAKIDATANDIAQDTFEVKGYPTLYFKSASGKVSAYDGERTKVDMINFIQKNREKARAQPSSPPPQAPAHSESQKEEL